ncbi:MAG: COX15/CtaA family protein [Polaribacter sp.]|nr:COX15/CtaA family protein [Polaribacter sp.]
MQNKTPKIVGYWLLLGAILVVAMVVIGGITRLTQSGLSIVEWKPISGIVPPLNTQDWMVEFNSYKTSPEYIKSNSHFSLDDFKSIFWWEFIHRFIGRLIGFVFLIPFIWFYVTKKITSKSLFKNLIIIFLLGGLQGFIGWFMVKSGLVNRPSVSHYRLALHLSTALFLVGYILWTALPIIAPITKKTPFFLKLYTKLKVLLALVSFQILYGAFTAGLKAGYMYPSYPKMGTDWLPLSGIEAFQHLGIVALFEDPVLVQFIHRWLAVVVVLFFINFFLSARKKDLSIIQKKCAKLLIWAIALQFFLGVFTLIYAVPVSLGVLHQLGAVIVLVALIIALYSYRPFKKI